MDIRERRAFEVLGTVQANLDEIDRRYKRLQRMLIIRYASIIALLMIIAIAWRWLWM